MKAKSHKSKPPASGAVSADEIAEYFSITARQARNWFSSGCPRDSLAGVGRWAWQRSKQREQNPQLLAARIAQATANARLKTLEVERQRGEMISKADHAEVTDWMAQQFIAVYDQAVTELPGKSAPEIEEWFNQQRRELLARDDQKSTAATAAGGEA